VVAEAVFPPSALSRPPHLCAGGRQTTAEVIRTRAPRHHHLYLLPDARWDLRLTDRPATPEPRSGTAHPHPARPGCGGWPVDTVLRRGDSRPRVAGRPCHAMGSYRVIEPGVHPQPGHDLICCCPAGPGTLDDGVTASRQRCPVLAQQPCQGSLSDRPPAIATGDHTTERACGL
jgi:hypothetical protein